MASKPTTFRNCCEQYSRRLEAKSVRAALAHLDDSIIEVNARGTWYSMPGDDAEDMSTAPWDVCGLSLARFRCSESYGVSSGT